MKMKHLEVLVKIVEVRLPEKIGPGEQDNRRSHRGGQQIWEPIPRSPIRGNQSEKNPLASSKLAENLLNQDEWWEHSSLETVPTLQTSIGPRCHGIHERREIDWKTIVQIGSKYIYHHWPLCLKLQNHILHQGPLGAEDLLTMAQGIRYHIPGSHDELQNQ